MLHEAAPAKVNLFLHVVGRTANGYHRLDSLAVFPPVADQLRAEPAATLTLAVEGPFAAGLEAEPANLVLRAAAALGKAAGCRAGASVVLQKNLPIASGIGGGSADAAAALRLLSRVWGLALPPAELAGVAASLGADVPVCLPSRPARMSGVGDLLGTAPELPACGILLVNPGVAVSTRAVFEARQAVYSAPAALPARWPDAAAMAEGLSRLTNDLQPPALSLCPEIADALQWLRARAGCLLARMSGSGATCYALFPDAFAARQAAAGTPPGWWAWGGALTV